MRMTSKLGSRSYTGLLILKRDEGNLRAGICFSHLPDSLSLAEIDEVLHPDEEAYYKTLEFEKRRRSYLIGRYAAKQAVGAFAQEKNLSKILIQPGIFNQPVVRCGDEHNVQVSITHCDELGAALAFPEAHPMAIDIEKIYTDKNNVLETQMTGKEREMVSAVPFPYETMLTLLWTAKESLSKILRTGLTAPFHIFEIDRIETKEDHTVSYFENFAQYKVISFNLGCYICSLTFPKNTNVYINIPVLRQMID